LVAGRATRREGSPSRPVHDTIALMAMYMSLLAGCASWWTVPALARSLPSRHPLDRMVVSTWSRCHRFGVSVAATITFAATTSSLPDLGHSTAAVAVGVPVLAAAAVDWRTGRLPDRLVAVSLCLLCVSVAVLAVAERSYEATTKALLGATLFGGALGVVRLLRPTTMGAGDVKFAFVLGGLAGTMASSHVSAATSVASAGFWACALSTIVGIVANCALGRAMRAPVPFGPGLALGTYLAVVVASRAA
jgi:leader peptidase (prepilin peptidase) / N-methyltransferase